MLRRLEEGNISRGSIYPGKSKKRLGPVMLSGCNTCRSDRLWIVAAGKVKQLVKQ